MVPEANAKFPSSGRSAALWAGVIGAPAVWGMQLQLGYAIAPWSCSTKMHLALHGLTLVALLLVIIAAAISHRDWKAAGGGSPDETLGGIVGRQRFLGVLGMLLSGLSAVVILAQGIASFFFDGCT
jgi:hypothetical protein